MILGVSTSSPVLALALIGEGGELRGQKTSALGHNLVEGGFLEIREFLAGHGLSLGELDGLWVDVGPGGFTSTRVGVTLGKIWAGMTGRELAAVSAFDLIGDGVTFVPSRKGEWLVRVPGEAEIQRMTDLPDGAQGYEHPNGLSRYPAFRAGLPLRAVTADDLLPDYVNAPSISQPKDRRILGGPR